MTPETVTSTFSPQRVFLTNHSSRDQVAAAIWAEATRRGYSPELTRAVFTLAMGESGLDQTAVGDGGRSYGIFQQDKSYTGRRNPNQQISEFFNRFDAKRNSPGASTDPWKNIFWLQQRPSARSADEAYNHPRARRQYLNEILRHAAEGSALYDRFAQWVPVRLYRPAGASDRIIELISCEEGFFNAVLDVLRTNNPKLAPEPLLCQAVPGMQGAGNAFKNYRDARVAFENELNGRRLQRSAVNRYTADAVPIAAAARNQLRSEEDWLNRVLRIIDLTSGKVREQRVVDDLTVATERVEKILQDATDPMQKLAARVKAAADAAPRDGSRRGRPGRGGTAGRR